MPDEYVPPPHGIAWETIEPARAGFDPAALGRAIAFARARETPWPRDLRAFLEAGYFDKPPDNALLGPVAPRGAPNGLVLRGGRMVAAWGDTRQVDMTFSIAKSYLSLLAGIARADGLIADLDEPVGRTVDDGGFAGPHNGAITWRHLLQLTSEWEGTLWDKSDAIDRNRDIGTEARGLKGTWRALQPPGTLWEYNDVRVNRFSLALLRRFRRPLPEVFRERIMAPLGASSDWRWDGYRNSFVEIEGRVMQSVPGGGHWGGGVFIHAEDQARIGLLMLRRGDWGGRRLLPEAWVRESTTPCACNPQYGFMWWLNTDGQRYPEASAASFFAFGAGGNVTWVDPAHHLVAVMRWMDPDAIGAFMGLVTAALGA
ncbi:MAG: serine hydrolase [Alphaproteobacteria bacterium]|nr:serine hydrolase [Alphaproteobacteria bacterium]